MSENIIIKNFREKKEKQFVFLLLIKDEIAKLNKEEVPVISQIRIIEDKYKVKLQNGTYRSWIRNNKPSFQNKEDKNNKVDPTGEEVYKKLLLAIAQNAFYLTLAVKENLSSSTEVHLWEILKDKVDSAYRGIHHYIVFYMDEGFEERASEMEVLHDKIFELIGIIGDERERGAKKHSKIQRIYYNQGFLKGYIKGRDALSYACTEYTSLSQTEKDLKLSTRFFIEN